MFVKNSKIYNKYRFLFYRSLNCTEKCYQKERRFSCGGKKERNEETG